MWRFRYLYGLMFVGQGSGFTWQEQMLLEWVVDSDLALIPSNNPVRLVLFRISQQN
jgi:hypothetical protein